MLIVKIFYYIFVQLISKIFILINKFHCYLNKLAAIGKISKKIKEALDKLECEVDGECIIIINTYIKAKKKII
jgi:hypothetical protein